MKIELIIIGKSIMQIVVTTPEGAIGEDVSDLNGLVSEEFIQDLKDVVHEIEDQNKYITEKLTK